MKKSKIDNTVIGVTLSLQLGEEVNELLTLSAKRSRRDEF